MTREIMADRIAAQIKNPLVAAQLFSGFSAATVSAILQFGPNKNELAAMYNNCHLAEIAAREVDHSSK